MKKIILAGLLIVGASGCATYPIPMQEAKNVPADRIFQTERLSQDGNVRAYFARDAGMYGNLVYIDLYIDGKKVASLNPGEKVEFDLPPGEHLFGVIQANRRNAAPNTIDQELKSGRQYFYRITTEEGSATATLQRFIPEP